MKRLVAPLLLMVMVATLPACGARRRAFQATATAVAGAASALAQPQSAGPLVMSAPIAVGGVLFQDDFQDGRPDGWNITAGWVVQQMGETYVLASSVPGSTWVSQGTGWTDYAFQVGTQVDAGGLILSYRVSQTGRYALHIRPEAMSLVKEQPRGMYTQLTQTNAPSLNNWHQVVVAGSGGHLQVYVDGVLQLDYTDATPLTTGTIGLTTQNGYQAEADNVLVTALSGPLPVAAALPPTVAPAATMPSMGAELPLEEIPAPQDTVVVEELVPEPLMTEAAIEGEAPVDMQPEGEGDIAPEGGGVLPVIDYFDYEPAGEDDCYYLSWDLHDATVAFLNGQGVVAPGSTEVCHPEPGAYVYTLHAESSAGAVEQVVTILVEMEEGADAADLTGEASVWVPAPANPRTVNVAIQINNSGQGGAGAFTVRWYPHQASDEVGCSIDVAGLPAQSNVALNPCSYTYAGHGEMHWRLAVDADNDVPGEVNEDNNQMQGTVSVGQAAMDGGDPSVPPVTPSNLAVGGWSADTVILTWVDNSDNEDGFRLRHVGVALEAETGPNVTEAEVPSPPCGEHHEYRVRAFNAAGDSEPSETLVIEYECQ